MLPSSLKSPTAFNAELIKQSEIGLPNLNLEQSADLLNKLLKGSVQPMELGKAGGRRRRRRSARRRSCSPRRR